jgi:hypothetical protein
VTLFLFYKQLGGFNMKQEFKGIWIPKDVLERGLLTITAFVLEEYQVDLLAENPLEGDEF